MTVSILEEFKSRLKNLLITTIWKGFLAGVITVCILSSIDHAPMICDKFTNIYENIRISLNSDEKENVFEDRGNTYVDVLENEIVAESSDNGSTLGDLKSIVSVFSIITKVCAILLLFLGMFRIIISFKTEDPEGVRVGMIQIFLSFISLFLPTLMETLL